MTQKDTIRLFMNCRACVAERPQHISAAEYARLNVGLTHDGNVQVWCLRHDMNVGIITPEMMAQHGDCQCEECVKEKHKKFMDGVAAGLKDAGFEKQ